MHMCIIKALTKNDEVCTVINYLNVCYTCYTERDLMLYMLYRA